MADYDFEDIERDVVRLVGVSLDDIDEDALHSVVDPDAVAQIVELLQPVIAAMRDFCEEFVKQLSPVVEAIIKLAEQIVDQIWERYVEDGAVYGETKAGMWLWFHEVAFTRQLDYTDVNGRINVQQHEDGTFSFDWTGGDIIAIAVELIESSDSAYDLIVRSGDRLEIGDFTLHIERELPDQGIVIAKRMYETVPAAAL